MATFVQSTFAEAISVAEMQDGAVHEFQTGDDRSPDFVQQTRGDARLVLVQQLDAFGRTAT
jgi:hypothetical protein